MTDRLKEKVTGLPQSPGVYIFKDAAGVILYIGKAKSLKKRVQTYFSRRLDSKTQAMVARIADVEFRLTPSEAQAQILESALVKEEQPHYNIDLKDDKSFPWICITKEKFPRVSICRRKKHENEGEALYYGPFTNVKLLRQAFKLMRRVFGFCTCKCERESRKKPCLYYRLGLCPAPCAGKISAHEYAERIEEIKLFLGSEYELLIEKLASRMQEASRESRFEEAARIRDQINSLGAIGNKPSGALSLNELEDLKSLIHLPHLPYRIEAFDISNIQGSSSCGSMVSFYKGEADKDNYRRFRIKTVSGIDDYRMIAEVVSRRYGRLIDERLKLPDLILIDGGRQHLNVALEELHKLKLNIPAISIAKDRENIYIKGRDEPVKLEKDTPALNLIRRVRDEAHRFAITYHRLLRKKRFLR